VNLNLHIISQDIAVVRCHGRLVCGAEGNELIRTFRNVLTKNKEIVVQMAEVSQIDSTGVGLLGEAFVAAHNRGAEIKLAELHPRVAKVLDITNLAMLFDIRGSESEAVSAFLTKEPPRKHSLDGVA